MRVSLSLTAMSAASLAGALTHQRTEIGHPPPADLLHDLLHLAELLHELVDLLHGGARSAGDPQPPRALDELGSPTLLGGHGEHDRLDAVELALVDLHVLQLLAAEARQHPQERLQRPHSPHHAQLTQEVLERELALAHLALEL